MSEGKRPFERSVREVTLIRGILNKYNVGECLHSPGLGEGHVVGCQWTFELYIYIYIYIYTHTHTYSMVQSPSLEANWFAASQEIPCISWNPKVHYRTHKRPPLVSILGQPNPVHIPTSHLLEIRPNIMHPSTPRSPQWFFPSGFPTKTLYTPLSSPIRATCPAHLFLLDFITCTMLGEE